MRTNDDERENTASKWATGCCSERRRSCWEKRSLSTRWSHIESSRWRSLWYLPKTKSGASPETVPCFKKLEGGVNAEREQAPPPDPPAEQQRREPDKAHQQRYERRRRLVRDQAAGSSRSGRERNVPVYLEDYETGTGRRRWRWEESHVNFRLCPKFLFLIFKSSLSSNIFRRAQFSVEALSYFWSSKFYPFNSPSNKRKVNDLLKCIFAGGV